MCGINLLKQILAIHHNFVKWHSEQKAKKHFLRLCMWIYMFWLWYHNPLAMVFIISDRRSTILIFQLNRANHSYVTKTSMFPLGPAIFHLVIIDQGRLVYMDSFKRCFTLEIKMTNEHSIKDRLLSCVSIDYASCSLVPSRVWFLVFSTSRVISQPGLQQITLKKHLLAKRICGFLACHLSAISTNGPCRLTSVTYGFKGPRQVFRSALRLLSGLSVSPFGRSASLTLLTSCSLPQSATLSDSLLPRSLLVDS